jgi:integrase
VRKRGTRGNGSIIRRNGKYQAQWSLTEGGKRVRKAETFILRRDAEWWLWEARRGNAPNVDLTVGEYLERWLAGKRKIRGSTLGLYRSHVETHIKPGLGHLPVTALQPRHVEAFVAGLSRDQSARRGSVAGTKALAPSTVGSILRTLRMALSHGVRRKELPDNPASGVESPEHRPQPVEAMTHVGVAALLDAVQGTWMEQLVRFLLGSGVRIGEAVALNQGDVMEGYVRIRRPKTVPRAVQVSDDGMAALREAIRLAPRSGAKEPVFYGPKSGDRLTRVVATHALPRLMERAGLPRMTPHLLRHGVATLMVASGVHMRLVAEQLGHSNPALTARVYAHVSPASARAAISVLDDAVSRK